MRMMQIVHRIWLSNPANQRHWITESTASVSITSRSRQELAMRNLYKQKQSYNFHTILLQWAYAGLKKLDDHLQRLMLITRFELAKSDRCSLVRCSPFFWIMYKKLPFKVGQHTMSCTTFRWEMPSVSQVSYNSLRGSRGTTAWACAPK